MTTFFRIGLMTAAAGILLGASFGSALAVGTAANTPINNQATLDYEVGGVNQPDVFSDNDADPLNGINPTSFRVDNKVDLTMATANVLAAGVDQALAFTIQNDGNNIQAYAVEFFAGAGDTIDMDNVRLFVDTGALGYDGGDTPLANIAGNLYGPTPDVAADGTLRILLVADTPAGAVTGDTADYTLKAFTYNASTHAAPGVLTAEDSGAADNPAVVQVVFADIDAGAGVGGATDGDENGAFLTTATFTIQAAIMEVMKTALVISDPFSAVNPKAIPGAIVEYTIDITNSGVAPADAVILTDPIPANTNFVVGSVTAPVGATISYDDGTNGWAYAPVDSGDGSDPVVSGVRVSIASVAGGGGTAQITFRVLIE